MDISLLLKVTGIGIIVMFAYIMLDRADRKEQALLVSIAGIILVLLMLMSEIENLLTSVRTIFGL